MEECESEKTHVAIKRRRVKHASFKDTVFSDRKRLFEYNFQGPSQNILPPLLLALRQQLCTCLTCVVTDVREENSKRYRASPRCILLWTFQR